MKGQQNEWDKILSCIAAACQSTPSESTGFSANMLMLGREVRLPTDLIFPNPKNKGEICVGTYVEELQANLERAHILARKHLEAAAVR